MTDRWTVHHAEVLEALSKYEDASIDGCLSDVPYGLGSKQPTVDELIAYLSGADLDSGGDFMGADWSVPSVRVWRELYRVLKPGAHVLSFAGSRTGDLVAIGMRAAGFEVRDVIQWIYACLSEDTEVLVDGEWLHWSEARVGRLALCYDATEDCFEWLPIQHQHAFWHDDTAIRVHSDSTDQIVTRNHRCLVERGGAYAFQLAEDAASEREARVPVLEDVHRLLGALPVPHEGTGGAKQDVRSSLRGQTDLTTPKRAQDKQNGPPNLRPVRFVRPGASPSRKVPSPSRQSYVLVRVQRKASWAGVGAACSQGFGGQNAGWAGEFSREDVRGTQPLLARRSNDTFGARELRGWTIRPLSGAVSADGAQGRLRDGAPSAGCASDRTAAPSLGGGPSREPQPEGQQDREPLAVRVERRPQAVRGDRFTSADMARFEPVHYRGVVWCITVPTGAFVARRNGKVFVTGNSGMPKSLDASKAIDKEAGAKREVVGSKAGFPGYREGPTGNNDVYGAGLANGSRKCEITAPATDDAKHWDGFGSALKPSYEPVILARKPLDGRLIDNVRKWGVGALAIDACRLAYLDEEDKAAAAAAAAAQRTVHQSHGAGVGDFGLHGENAAGSLSTFLAKQELGRWPANVCLDEFSADLLDAQSGDRPGMSGGGQHRTDYDGGMFGAIDSTHTARGDRGGASRFLYCPKASREERDRGCDHLPIRSAGKTVKRKEGSAGIQSGRAGAGRTSGARNYGPCVKPVALTRWLATLILPPPRRDGSPRRILVPYAGTGSEMVGAILAGWDRVEGIEREPRPGVENAPDFLAILKARVHLAATNPRAFDPDARRKVEKVDERQIGLFGGAR